MTIDAGLHCDIQGVDFELKLWMKTIPFLIAVSLLISSRLAVKAGADENKTVTPAETRNAQQEDLGFDVFEGKTNRIARVAKVDPRFVWVVYEDSKTGRKIPRAELPPQLQAKYPYDPQKAVASINAHAQEAQAEAAAQKTALRQKEHNLQSQVDALEKQMTENEKEIGNLDRKLKTMPKSKTLKAQKIKMLSDQDELRKRKTDLTDRLKQVRAQIDELH
jgi:hypothetical protein